ncbi:MAG: hypothetical protein NZ770_06040 [Candidatus Poseidoniaceae archaeon]|nr:hypothetical protein [Candidatus Poseidoniaceae archaeon]
MGSKIPRIIAVILGILIIGVSVFNVHVGLGSFGGEPAKLMWNNIATDTCSKALSGDFEDESEIEDCVGATGLYELHDLIGLCIGMIPLLVGALPKKKKGRRGKGGGGAANKKLAKRMRSAKIKMSFGLTFFILIALDAMGQLSPDKEPIDFQSLTGLPLPSVIIYSVFGLLGLRSILNGLSKRKHTLGLKEKHDEGGGMVADGHSMAIQERMFRDNRIGDPFAGKHKVKGMGDFRTVGEMRKSMKLDQYDDSFERGLYDDGSVDDMGRTCHYCSGQGCAQCNMTGHL